MISAPPIAPISRQARYSRRQSEQDAEIGPPILTDEERSRGEALRAACWDDLEAFNVKVFPNSTGLKPLGAVQKDSIAHDQSVIVNGGRVCKAEPRAYGKTTRTCNAALWAVLTGRRRMVPIFSASMDKSRNQVMSRWREELRGNDLLFWMFPELIWPLRRLEGKPQRCKGQTMNGAYTHTVWKADRIVLPYVSGVPGFSAALIALPLKSCRGVNHTTPDQEVLRPELCIFDDVQKDEDSSNPNTIAKIEEDIDHAAMMLGGHSQTMSAIMNCTVRRPDDLSEKFLKKKSWRRVRYKMLTAPSEGEKEHWLSRYADIRQAYDPESPDDQERAQRDSLAYYLANREAMDRGAAVTWDWAYAWKDDDPTEISALQHAYNIRIDLGEPVFASECQNEPVRDTGGLELLTPDQIMRKQSGYARGTFPPECTTLTTFVDVHPSILYWEVWAWEPNFTGYLIDYGTYPDQKRLNFAHTMLSKRLEDLFPGRDAEATVTAGLAALFEGDEDWLGLLRKQYVSTGCVPLKIARLHIDANGEASEGVKKYVRQSDFSAILAPSFGKGVSAKAKPISQWQQSIGQRNIGPEWVPTQAKPGQPQGVIFDTNYWKTRFHRALALPNGSSGALYLFKTDAENHRRIAQHWTSEKPTEVTVGSRVVHEWGQKPGTDNHDFDCGVGNMVVASRCGITNIKSTAKPVQRLNLAEIQKKAMAR